MRKLMMVSAAVLSAVLISGVANAQIAPFSLVQRVSVSHGITDGTSNTIVSLAQAKDGSTAVIARTFDAATGFQRGEALLLVGLENGTAKPVDVILSTVFQPGSVLVLDTARRVHVFPLQVFGDGSVRLAAAETIVGPIGPDGSGAGNVLGEVPNPRNPSDPFLAIGTTMGQVLITTNNNVRLPAAVLSMTSNVAITDLGAFTQNGYIALGAVSGGGLFVINPDDDSAAGLQPALKSQLRDPRRVWLDLGTPELRRDSLPLSDHTTSPYWIADGTSNIAAYSIQSNMSLGPIVLSATAIQSFATPIKQIVPGSLTWLPEDGSGILYNRAFTPEGGLSGRIWTIGGASMILDPEKLNLRSRGRFITATIECENQRATEIVVSSLKLSIVGADGFVSAAQHPAAELEDVDGDTNYDLLVKFDRDELIDLSSHTHANSAVVRVTWRYADGTEGSASAQIRLRE